MWRPRWWLAGRWCSLILPPVLLACLAGLARPDWLAAIRRLQNASTFCALLFSVGVGLLLLPPQDRELVVSSVSELRRRQAYALLGGWAVGLYAIAAAVTVTATPTQTTFLLAGGLMLATAAMPFFLRIPLHSLVAAALMAAAIAIR